jgi:hypothetical protein
MRPLPWLCNIPKRNRKVGIIGAIDPDHSGLDLSSDDVRACDILREDCGAEAVAGVVRSLDSLGLRAELVDADEGTKHFFFADGVVILLLLASVPRQLRGRRPYGNILENSRLHKVSTGRSSAQHQRCALGLALLHKRHDTFILLPGDLRALRGVLTEGITDDAGSFRVLLEALHKLVVDAFLHQDPGGSRADLARVGHDPDVRPFHGLVDVGVVKDQQGTLAASLEGYVLEVYRRRFHYRAAGGCAACKRDLVDIRVRGDRGAGGAAVAGDDVDDAGREAGFLDQRGQEEYRQRALFGSLQDHGISRRQRRAEFPRRHHQRVIPRDDLAAHADRLVECVHQFRGADVDGFAPDLVGPARIVPEGADAFSQILGFGDGKRLAYIPGVYGR